MQFIQCPKIKKRKKPLEDESQCFEIPSVDLNLKTTPIFYKRDPRNPVFQGFYRILHLISRPTDFYCWLVNIFSSKILKKKCRTFTILHYD